MRIGEMVRRTGVSERLLRYYEEQGLLTPERLPSGYRVYSEADVHTVRRIRILLAAGLPTATIARALPCLRDDDPSHLAPVCSGLVAELRRERERITRTIDDLRASRNLLDAVIEAGPDDTGAPDGAGARPDDTALFASGPSAA
ncbi:MULTISPECIES: MerR family transcriptional regulator [Streptomyces]|uniref:MerR family transcriptional regulator n=2 Tax=Streptomyces TaxID=1883 RepID=A0A2U9NY79_STRAS|nr:MerR family transcriptional regulator [Streptomyces actuosus]AWT41815.1 MerR family transcriptional regulator [Streptomyces actuosus]MBM4825580.1 MerR family transcriptional regulator [Streptomyces actuosus]